jgi:hypothetical protein
MALADYQPQRQTIPFKGGSFEVKGLSLDDVAVLMKHHLTDLDELFELYAKNVNPEMAVAVTAQYAVSLVREAPGLVAQIIALAAEEPDMVPMARKLSMPIQVEALKTIATLTFDDAGGAKKFYESLIGLVAGLRPPAATTGSPT